VAGVALALVAAFVIRDVIGNRSEAQFERLARASGCTEVKETGQSGSQQHLSVGETTRYDTSPPTHGAHDPSALRAGTYSEPFSDDPRDDTTIYKAVHSLEHGYIIVWYDGLSKDQVRALERRYRNERKVILAPYPKLKGDEKVALTAWGRLMECERPSDDVIDGFVGRFREARSAPEPKGV
jgi:uncharacterized protein DUF3105